MVSTRTNNGLARTEDMVQESVQHINYGDVKREK